MTGRKRVIMTFQEFQASTKLVQDVEEMKELAGKLDYPMEKDYSLIDFHVYIDSYIIEYSRITDEYYVLLGNQEYVSEELLPLEERLFLDCMCGEMTPASISKEIFAAKASLEKKLELVGQYLRELKSEYANDIYYNHEKLGPFAKMELLEVDFIPQGILQPLEEMCQDFSFVARQQRFITIWKRS